MSNGKSTTHLVAGFAGGLTSALALQPLDLLKTRVQQSRDAKLLSTLKQFTNIQQLWRGTLPSALRTSIGSGLYLSFLNFTRSKLSTQQASAKSTSMLPKLGNWANLATGMFARSVVGCITMPVTVLKVRFESDVYQYRSLSEAVRSIYATEGTKGFFRGVVATTARDAPNAGLYVLFYEKLKSMIPRMLSSETEFKTSTSAMVNSGSAMTAAALSTTITAPFDTIKTCMQLHPETYTGFTSTLAKLIREEGVLRMFDGLSLRLTRKALSAGIAWCIYEELIKIF